MNFTGCEKQKERLELVIVAYPIVAIENPDMKLPGVSDGSMHRETGSKKTQTVEV